MEQWLKLTGERGQGSVYGAFQGYARAFYAEFIPPGEEARWYGLFSITDKVCVLLATIVTGHFLKHA